MSSAGPDGRERFSVVASHSAGRRQTSLRSRPPAETMRVARRLMKPLGLSRVIDATSLDRLGVPVFLSLRPAGLTLRVHAGKGFDAEDARIGALMEGLEFAVAERASAAGPDGTRTLDELAARLPDGLQWSDFSPRLGVPAPGDRRVAIWSCTTLHDRRRVRLPAELLMLPSPPEAAPPLFGWTTNGLASGNTLDEATLHALLEVLERDAIAMNGARMEGARVDSDRLPEPVASFVAAWKPLGIGLYLRYLPSALGLACFEATLHEPGHPQIELARGFGLHPQRELALARAVSEAAQSRVSRLHRQLPEHAVFYEGRPLPASASAPGSTQRLLAELNDASVPTTDFGALPSQTCGSIRETLRVLLGRLAAAGLGPVFRRRMVPADGLDLLGLHVVKVVIARCENSMSSQVRMGPRLLQRVISPAASG